LHRNEAQSSSVLLPMLATFLASGFKLLVSRSEDLQNQPTNSAYEAYDEKAPMWNAAS
jgi:hypothetical protein